MRIVELPCENKGADQLFCNSTADQRLCFRYTNRTISLILKSKFTSFKTCFVTAKTGLCRTWSETPLRLGYCMYER